MKGSTAVEEPGRYLRILQFIVFGALFLYFGKPLFITLGFAVLISFILYPICVWIEKKSYKRITAIFISMMLLSLVLLSICALLVHQFISFWEEWPFIKPKLLESLDLLSTYFSDQWALTREDQNLWLKQILNTSMPVLVKDLLSAYAFSAVMAIIIPIFSVLILYHRARLVNVIYRMVPVETRIDIKNILSLSIPTYYNFVKGMLIVYLIVGLLNSLGLWIIGVPHAFLFGFIAAILTFIPYVGIIIGSLLPITMSWITYNSIWYPVSVMALFAVVQYLEANLIFPLAVSNKLHINALATLIAIILGGILWGVAGMILFVPFLALIKLIADNHPDLKTVSMLLGTSKTDK
ncbi:MAG TPA: AI-2E family transporter [Cyclobacteriaceae bacterium]